MNRRIPLWLIPLLFISATLAQPTTAEETDAHFQVPATDDGLPGAGPIRRHDWFRKLWAERRSVWAKRVPQDQHVDRLPR